MPTRDPSSGSASLEQRTSQGGGTRGRPRRRGAPRRRQPVPPFSRRTRPRVPYLRSTASPATSSTQRRVEGIVANSHESRMNSEGLLPIHRSAWNINSRKSICRILHRSFSWRREDGFYGPSHREAEVYVLWCWMDMQGDECSGDVAHALATFTRRMHKAPDLQRVIPLRPVPVP